MRNPLLVSVVSVVLAASAVAQETALNQLSDVDKKEGFKLLFNGKNLDGWEHAGNWKVVDGTVHRADKGGNLTYKVSKVPDNFVLKFEWKVAPGSNSGVYYRPGQYEYQILDNNGHPNGKDPRTSAASLYYAIAPQEDATKEVGQWNTGKIVCQGTTIEHWLNGKKVVDVNYRDSKHADAFARLENDRKTDMDARGAFLYLQDHGDPVWFRNIRLLDLSQE